MPSINDLKSLIAGRQGLAAQNRYQVTMTVPEAAKRIFPEAATTSGSVLNLMCDSTSLPGRQITTLDYQSHKQSIKIPYGFMNEDVSFTFLLTGDYYAKKVFDAWNQATIDFANYRANYLLQYTSDVRVYQMIKGEQGDRIGYGVVLKHAFPITVGGLNLDNSAENTVQRLGVVMTYENFEVLP